MEVSQVIEFIVIVYLVAISQCTSVDREDFKEWQNHNARIQKFKCSSPQPRSLSFDEIAPEFDLGDINPKEVFPTLTVLHTCDSQAGCCDNFQYTCGPKKSEEVTLTFKIHPRNGRHAVRHKKHFLHVTATNHTECHCSSNSNSPKK